MPLLSFSNYEFCISRGHVRMTVQKYIIFAFIFLALIAGCAFVPVDNPSFSRAAVGSPAG